MSQEGTSSVGQQVGLHTPQLLLRAAVEDDAKYLHEVFKDPEGMRYWSELPHPNQKRTDEWVASMISSPNNGTTDFVVCLKASNNKPIGKIGVWQGDEIGFILHRSHWHEGLAKEALRKVLPYLLEERKFESIHADVDPRNEASLRLLRLFGFEDEGFEKGTLKVGEEWVDSVYLRLRS